MNITVSDLGKRFHYHWIFRKLTFSFPTNSCTALIGPNGSGKSTLLKTIAGFIDPNEGAITYEIDSTTISTENIFSHLSFAAPYQEIIEELTLKELLTFHQKFKPLTITDQDFLTQTLLTDAKNKTIRDFSSGMKQRVKLGLALFSDVRCVLLDEPTTNMDQQGIDWYRNVITDLKGKKTILISSNMPFEFDFCDQSINILDYK